MTYIYKKFVTGYIPDLVNDMYNYLETASNPETAKIAMGDQNNADARGFVITDPDLQSAPTPLFGSHKWIKTVYKCDSNSDFEPKIQEITDTLNNLTPAQAYSAQLLMSNCNNEPGYLSLWYLSE